MLLFACVVILHLILVYRTGSLMQVLCPSPGVGKQECKSRTSNNHAEEIIVQPKFAQETCKFQTRRHVLFYTLRLHTTSANTFTKHVERTKNSSRTVVVQDMRKVRPSPRATFGQKNLEQPHIMEFAEKFYKCSPDLDWETLLYTIHSPPAR